MNFKNFKYMLKVNTGTNEIFILDEFGPFCDYLITLLDFESNVERIKQKLQK